MTGHLVESLSLIIPAFNAAPFLERRLEEARAWLAAQERETELLVVDDGSRDATPKILADFDGGAADFHWIRTEGNRGKGHAVRTGMLEAGGAFRVFIDADTSYPVENVAQVVRALEHGADVAIGNRAHAESRYEVTDPELLRLWMRKGVGRVFNGFARLCALPGIEDSQAGLKGLTAAAASEIFSRCSVDRFAFDVELLLWARRLRQRIADVPVRIVWGRDSSTLRLGRDGLRMAWDVARLGMRAGRAVEPELEPDPVIRQA
jgi:dolichyl-phosphate beta-glucosyltransferase